MNFYEDAKKTLMQKNARQMLQRGKNRDKVWGYLKRSKAWNNKK